MYKMTLDIADDDMRFLAYSAPLYGKENAAPESGGDAPPRRL